MVSAGAEGLGALPGSHRPRRRHEGSSLATDATHYLLRAPHDTKSLCRTPTHPGRSPPPGAVARHRPRPLPGEAERAGLPGAPQADRAPPVRDAAAAGAGEVAA